MIDRGELQRNLDESRDEFLKTFIGKCFAHKHNGHQKYYEVLGRSCVQYLDVIEYDIPTPESNYWYMSINRSIASPDGVHWKECPREVVDLAVANALEAQRQTPRKAQ